MLPLLVWLVFLDMHGRIRDAAVWLHVRPL